MNISIDETSAEFLESIVKSGRYGSASEVVREGLRLVEERETKLQALREMIDQSLAEGGENTSADVRKALKAKGDELAKAGY